MVEGGIDASALLRIRDAVFAWARARGEEHPQRGRVVATNRDAAVRWLQPGASSEPEDCYLAVLEGCFMVPAAPDTRPREGVWAAVMVDLDRVTAGPFTIRPGGHIPQSPLDRLGRVYPLDFD